MQHKHIVIADMPKRHVICYLGVDYALPFGCQESFESAARANVKAMMSALKTQRPFQKSRSLEICIVLEGGAMVFGVSASFGEPSLRSILAGSANTVLVKHQCCDMLRATTYRGRPRN